jgi:hypothetical protein
MRVACRKKKRMRMKQNRGLDRSPRPGHPASITARDCEHLASTEIEHKDSEDCDSAGHDLASHKSNNVLPSNSSCDCARLIAHGRAWVDGPRANPTEIRGGHCPVDLEVVAPSCCDVSSATNGCRWQSELEAELPWSCQKRSVFPVAQHHRPAHARTCMS